MISAGALPAPLMITETIGCFFTTLGLVHDIRCSLLAPLMLTATIGCFSITGHLVHVIRWCVASSINDYSNHRLFLYNTWFGSCYLPALLMITATAGCFSVTGHLVHDIRCSLLAPLMITATIGCFSITGHFGS